MHIALVQGHVDNTANPRSLRWKHLGVRKSGMSEQGDTQRRETPAQTESKLRPESRGSHSQTDDFSTRAKPGSGCPPAPGCPDASAAEAAGEGECREMTQLASLLGASSKSTQILYLLHGTEAGSAAQTGTLPHLESQR